MSLDNGSHTERGHIPLSFTRVDGLRAFATALARVPPGFFAISFGLAGWRRMAADDIGVRLARGSRGHTFVASALVWALLAAGSLARVLRTPREILGELRDPVASPFWALPWVIGMLLAAGLQPHAPHVAKVVFVVFLAATILFGGWLTGQWIVIPLEQAKLHVGYLLPTWRVGLWALGARRVLACAGSGGSASGSGSSAGCCLDR